MNILQKLWEDFLGRVKTEETQLDNETYALLEALKDRVTAIEAHLVANNDSLPVKYAPAVAEPVTGDDTVQGAAAT